MPQALQVAAGLIVAFHPREHGQGIARQTYQARDALTSPGCSAVQTGNAFGDVDEDRGEGVMPQVGISEDQSNHIKQLVVGKGALAKNGVGFSQEVVEPKQ